MVALCRPGLLACYHGVWLITSELVFLLWWLPPILFFTQLSATDVSVRTTMKGAAKCDKHCELQNSVNQQGFERILRFRDIPESMPASVSMYIHSSTFACLCARSVLVSICVLGFLFWALTHSGHRAFCDNQLEEHLMRFLLALLRKSS